MIFFLIAGTYTPFALLVLHGALATAILIVVWIGAIAGAIVEMIWIDHPKWVAALIYLSLGWVAVAAFPELWTLDRRRRLAAGRRRRPPLHGRRRRLRDPAPEPEPGDLRLPRGLPPLRDRRRRRPLLRRSPSSPCRTPKARVLVRPLIEGRNELFEISPAARKSALAALTVSLTLVFVPAASAPNFWGAIAVDPESGITGTVLRLSRPRKPPSTRRLPSARSAATAAKSRSGSPTAGPRW